MKNINWRKGLEGGAAEEGGSEQMHVPGWGEQRAGRKTSLRGIAALMLRTENNTRGLRERQTSHQNV